MSGLCCCTASNRPVCANRNNRCPPCRFGFSKANKQGPFRATQTYQGGAAESIRCVRACVRVCDKLERGAGDMDKLCITRLPGVCVCDKLERLEICTGCASIRPYRSDLTHLKGLSSCSLKRLQLTGNMKCTVLRVVSRVLAFVKSLFQPL